jgi:hypothetical protein
MASLFEYPVTVFMGIQRESSEYIRNKSISIKAYRQGSIIPTRLLWERLMNFIKREKAKENSSSIAITVIKAGITAGNV